MSQPGTSPNGLAAPGTGATALNFKPHSYFVTHKTHLEHTPKLVLQPVKCGKDPMNSQILATL